MSRLPLSLLAAALLIVAPLSSVHAQKPDPKVTTPRSFLGFTPGDDYKLANYTQSYAYFHTLAQQTKRLRLYEVGKTAGGVPTLLAVISSERNLARLDRLKSLARTLADGRVSEAEARRLAKEGKPFVWIDGGMHASEVGCAQHTINLGYDMVARNDPAYEHLRGNAVLLLIPSINPDGQNLVANWFTQHYGTPQEGTPLPVLWQKYSGHDNNRDWYMLNLPETRNITRLLYDQWFPQVVYNHHQSAPFPARIFVPPYDEPMNPHIPPLVMRGIHLFGTAMHQRFEEEDKPGVVSEKTYSAWWNGGMRTAPFFHNTIGILTETAHPSPYPAQIRVTRAQQEPTVWYPNPYRGGTWHFADTVAYMNTGSMAVLQQAADHGESLLLNRWRMAHAAIQAGERESPYGFIVPLDTQRQRDPATAALFLERMRLSGLEVQCAQAPFTQDGQSYPAGTAVLLSAQPNRPHLLDMVLPQRHPMRVQYPGGPPVRPYDIAGWTLTLQMGVTTIPMTTPPGAQTRASLRLATAPLRYTAPTLAPAPAGGAYVLPARQNASFTLANRLLAQGIGVGRDKDGNFIVPAGDAAFRALSALIANQGAIVETIVAAPTVAPLRAPRVATYDPYGGNMAQGWTQLTLETFGFAHTSLTNPELRAGNLQAKCDTLILTTYPNVRTRTLGDAPEEGAPDTSANGLGPGFLGGPAPRALAPEVKARLEGIGPDGEANLRRFVEEGGTLVAFHGAAAPVIRLFNLPLRNVVTGTKFYSPGSIFRVNLDTKNPLCAGLPETVSLYFDKGPVWETTAPGAFAHYPDSNPLLSGWIIEDSVIRNQTAAARFSVGKGRVVVYGFDVIFRGQPHQGFPLLFNALYPAE